MYRKTSANRTNFYLQPKCLTLVDSTLDRKISKTLSAISFNCKCLPFFFLPQNAQSSPGRRSYCLLYCQNFKALLLS